MSEENIGSSRKLLGNSVFYAIADILGKGLHFILLPIYTAYLTTDDYGIQNIVIGFNSVMNYVVLLCLDSAALKFYSEYGDDKVTLKRFYGTAMSIMSIFSCVVVTVCVFFQSVLKELIFDEIPFVPYVLLGLAILVLDAVYTLHRRMMEAQQQGKKVAAVGFTAVFFSSCTTVIMIGVLKLGVLGVLTATLFTSIGTVIFSIWDMIRHDMLTPCLDRKLAKKMLRYSIPLIPHQISGYLAALISKIFLNLSGSLSMVGLYGIATQFSSIVDTFQDATSRAYRPWLFAILNCGVEPDKNRIRNISNVLMSAYSVVVVGMGLFAQEIILIMTSESYHEAWKVIPVLVMAVSVKSIHYFYFAQCLFYPNTSKKIFIASVIANLSNIITAAIFVPFLGMYGSAAASLVSIIINTAIIMFINRKNGQIGYQFSSLAARLLLSWIVIVMGIFPTYIVWNQKLSFLNFLYKSSVIVLYIGVIWKMNCKEIYQFTNTTNIRELAWKLRNK